MQIIIFFQSKANQVKTLIAMQLSYLILYIKFFLQNSVSTSRHFPKPDYIKYLAGRTGGAHMHGNVKDLSVPKCHLAPSLIRS